MSNAAPVLDVILGRKLKASIGVIAARLDSTAATGYKKYILAKDDKGDKLFEIWNHGYDHTNNNSPDKNAEFKGTGLAFQQEHFSKAHQRVKDLLGIEMHTFGALSIPLIRSSIKLLGNTLLTKGYFLQVSNQRE